MTSDDGEGTPTYANRIDWVEFLDDLAKTSKEPRPEETREHLKMLCEYGNGCPTMVDPRAVLRLFATLDAMTERAEKAEQMVCDVLNCMDHDRECEEEGEGHCCLDGWHQMYLTLTAWWAGDD